VGVMDTVENIRILTTVIATLRVLHTETVVLTTNRRVLMETSAPTVVKEYAENTTRTKIVFAILPVLITVIAVLITKNYVLPVVEVDALDFVEEITPMKGVIVIPLVLTIMIAVATTKKNV